MQLPGLIQGHLRKLHHIDIIFAMEGAHPSLRVHRIADSIAEVSTEGMDSSNCRP